MAILMLAETMKGEYGDVQKRMAQIEFKGDLWVQRRRVGHAVDAFMGVFKDASIDNLELARIFCVENPRIAAMVAGVEFERLLRTFCSGKTRDDDIPVRALLRDLGRNNQVSLPDVRELNSVWDARNAAMHPDTSGFQLDSESVERMISRIVMTCERWKPRLAVNALERKRPI